MLWLRADLGFSGSIWVDQTGNGNSPQQATTAKQPTLSSMNGLAALSFNGTSQFMQTAGALSASPKTVFLVGNTSTQTSQRAVTVTSPRAEHVGHVGLASRYAITGSW